MKAMRKIFVDNKKFLAQVNLKSIIGHKTTLRLIAQRLSSVHLLQTSTSNYEEDGFPVP